MDPSIIDTPIGRFYATPTKPGHAELRTVDGGPVTVHGVAYVIRGEFQACDSWVESRMPGWQRLEHAEPYASHVGGYAICRHRPGERWPDCRSDALTQKGRYAIGRAIGPALKAFLAAPEVRVDALVAQREAWAARWRTRAAYYRDEAARLVTKAEEAERGADAIAAGGPFSEPPYHLTVR